MTLKLFAHQPMWDDETHFLFKETSHGGLFYAKPLEFQALPEGQIIDSVFKLSDGETQALFNQLWHLGFRPKDGTGSSGHVGSIERHLEDMRALAFSKLKVDKP